jgi:hypothetical protein
MYSVHDYGRMAADPVRMNAYARAIERVVKPGSIVVDIGAGTGIFSLLAARAGAKRVHAIEIDSAVWLLQDLAKTNGFSDVITIHDRASFEVSLPERADVVVSDMRGACPLFLDHGAAIRDARERFLKENGVLLPTKDTVFAAFVEAPGMWRHLEHGWEGFARQGFDPSAARNALLNFHHTDRPAPIHASDVLTNTHPWAVIDYGHFESAAIDTKLDFECVRNGIAHGIAVWFEAQIFEDLGYTSAPGYSLVYPRVFLPLLEPLALTAGEQTRVTLRVDIEGQRWAWDTETPRQRFRQTNFFGIPTSPDELLRGSSHHRPVRSERGDRTKAILDAMDGVRTVSDIVDEVTQGASSGAIREIERDQATQLIRRFAR